MSPDKMETFDRYGLAEGLVTELFEGEYSLYQVTSVIDALQTLEKEKAGETAYEVIMDSIEDRKTPGKIINTSNNMANISKLKKSQQEKLLSGLNNNDYGGDTVYRAASSLSKSEVDALRGGLSEIWNVEKIPDRIFKAILKSTKKGCCEASFSLKSKNFAALARGGVRDEAWKFLVETIENPKAPLDAIGAVADGLGLLSHLNEEQLENVNDVLGEDLYGYIRRRRDEGDIWWEKKSLSSYNHGGSLGAVMNAIMPLAWNGVEDKEAYELALEAANDELHFTTRHIGKIMATIWNIRDAFSDEVKQDLYKLVKESIKDFENDVMLSHNSSAPFVKDMLAMYRAGLPEGAYTLFSDRLRTRGNDSEHLLGWHDENKKYHSLNGLEAYSYYLSDRLVKINKFVEKLPEGAGQRIWSYLDKEARGRPLEENLLGYIASDLLHFSEGTKEIPEADNLYNVWVNLLELGVWQSCTENQKYMIHLAKDMPETLKSIEAFKEVSMERDITGWGKHLSSYSKDQLRNVSLAEN